MTLGKFARFVLLLIAAAAAAVFFAGCITIRRQITSRDFGAQMCSVPTSEIVREPVDYCELLCPVGMGWLAGCDCPSGGGGSGADLFPPD